MLTKNEKVEEKNLSQDTTFIPKYIVVSYSLKTNDITDLPKKKSSALNVTEYQTSYRIECWMDIKHGEIRFDSLHYHRIS